ncbi:polyprenyl synthetase family protein [Acetobacteraceae bacterium]|nr:polyprenyl synthetase family protein [Acetobacteraceae bacterium]
MTSAAPTLKNVMKKEAETVEEALNQLVPELTNSGQLTEAMRYAVLGGGKRLRAFLAITGSRLLGASSEQALRIGAAIECIHAYSLIHDDLPCMDDDDLRRGKPSTHVQYGDALALLAGDALQTTAFEILLHPQTSPSAQIRTELALGLSHASGVNGMVGGQVLDIEGEKKSLNINQIRQIHAMKTGALLRFSAESGAILAGLSKEDSQRRALFQFGTYLGTAFQIADDILDATATGEVLGKTAGKDAAAGKSTYVSCLGLEGAREEANNVVQEAVKALKNFGDSKEAVLLSDLAYYVIERQN